MKDLKVLFGSKTAAAEIHAIKHFETVVNKGLAKVFEGPSIVYNVNIKVIFPIGAGQISIRIGYDEPCTEEDLDLVTEKLRKKIREGTD